MATKKAPDYPVKQVGTWKPYKSGGGRPPDPPPLGRAPVAGFPNPRFPTVGPTDIAPPPGGYQSIIDTRAPFNPAQMIQMANVLAPSMNFGTGSGDQSRAAFARGMQDTSKAALMRSADQFNTDYQRQAEKSRSEDFLSQRQNAADRFRMELFKAIFDADTDTRYTTGIKDLSQYYATEKWNQETKRTAMALRFVGSLI